MMRDNEKSSSIPAAKQEACSGDQKAVLKPSSSRHWSSAGFRNPRIVRVSRTFGGKDRHSKVCTVRGLRDRRIRLSVPTAIELYDLQDRLGLSQPSKVIDWLIDNTKNDIDKLPPLQFPQGSLLPSSAQFLDHHHHFNDQDQFSQKLFGMLPYNNNIGYFHGNNNQSSSPSLSLSSHHQFGLGQLSLPQVLVDGSNSSTTFNNNNNNNNTQFYYPHPYITNHDQTADRSSSSSSSSSSTSSSSRMIINQHHQIQLLTSVGTPLQNTSSSLLFPNNFSLMSSLQNSGTTNSANDHSSTNTNSLFKSFPAIFNPGFLSFGNRSEKEDQS